MVILKLVFYSWLAILGGMSWMVDDFALSGRIVSNALCMLAFFGGIVGMWATLVMELRDDTL